MSSIPKTQSAWLVVRRGRPENAVVLKTDVPVPSKLGQGEVLVRVQAAALNPIGYKMTRVMPNFIAHRPNVAEHDLAGVVVDANGSQFTNGDPVFGIIPTDLQFKTGQGALAQYARLPSTHLVRYPSNISPTEAAGLALAGQTAYQALFNNASLQHGQRVLVNGGSTSVGAFAIQIAKAHGCHVTAIASGKNEEFVRNLGADDFIDYTKAQLPNQLSSNPPSVKYHTILDAVGLIEPALYTQSPTYLAPGGVFVSTGPMPSLSWYGMSNLMLYVKAIITPTWIGGTPRPWKLVQVENKPETLKALSDLVADGKLKPVVDSVFSFADVHKAYERILTGRARGKVIVRVDENAA
jgi:NADPH:quinone reductase-like Zn-dependent oxidoreductase